MGELGDASLGNFISDMTNGTFVRNRIPSPVGQVQKLFYCHEVHNRLCMQPLVTAAAALLWKKSTHHEGDQFDHSAMNFDEQLGQTS